VAAQPSALPAPPDSAPTTPQAVAPAPAQPSVEMQQVSRKIIALVQETRAIAQLVPSTAPIVSKIHDLLRQMVMEAMKSQQPTEPAAPPVA